MNEENKNETNENQKTSFSSLPFVLTVRLGQEERKMIEVLKGPPHWINISKYIRATIRHLYESKINKAGRAK